jgi:hypothetical protein
MAINDEDLRHDAIEFEPSVEPRKSKAWLNLLTESEEAFERWNYHCDRIDKSLASLERLADRVRDKQFQMLWANIEVIKPSIYARPPKPVVVPKFKDRRPVYQQASEVLERCAVVALDLAHINDLMIQLRDDIAVTGRGVPWLRYESGGRGGYYGKRERVCFDYKHRRDFLHSISRCWYEVTWVAGASYLTRPEARERFKKHSGDAYQEAEYKVDKESKEVGGADDRERAQFWEIWHKTENRVVWVSHGCEDILDESEPHLDLQDFFPCPRPAYGTLQRGSLVPVPDPMQYQDQLDELNMLTAKIHSLSDALEAKGFYPAGGAEIADAIETAVKIKTPGKVLIPISNWAAFGGSKEIIIWMPIEEIAAVVNQLIATRKQVIEDIYQITGLSDIMRGATDARETLGAQQLKSQFGSSRIKDKQLEMVRVARDMTAIACEIMTQKFDDVTLIEMSQTQLITKRDQQQQVMQLEQQMAQQMQQIQQQAGSPQIQQMQQSNPDQFQQTIAQAQQQMTQLEDELNKIKEQPNIDQVLAFLRNNRSKAFVLDIETDSTIMIDEKAEKESRAEFLSMLSPVLQQLGQMVMSDPGTADFAGEILKFSTAPFRAGRSLDGSIDELVEHYKARGAQPQGDDPTTAAAKDTNKTALQIEQLKQQRQAEKDKADTALKAADMQMKDRHEQMKIASNERIKAAELAAKQRDEEAKAQHTNLKAMHDRESHQMDMIGKQAEMQANEQKMAMAAQASQAKQVDMQARGEERRQAQQFKQQQGAAGREFFTQ